MNIKDPAPAPTDITLPGHNGRDMQVCRYGSSYTMAIMRLTAVNKDACFQLMSEPAGDYIAYRNGKDEIDTLAVSIDSNAIRFQLVMPGPGDEMKRVRNFSLDELIALVGTSDIGK